MKKHLEILIATLMFCVLGFAPATSMADGGSLRYSITVSKFNNESGWSGRWDLGNSFTTIMTAALQSSGKFIVLGDSEMRNTAMAEQDVAASGRVAGGKKTPHVGRMTPAQLLVRGAITHVEQSTSGGGGGFSIKGISIGASGDTAEINVTIYLVNSETGQVVASKQIVGKSDRSAFKIGYHGSKLGGLTGDMDSFSKDNVGKATEDAIGQAVEMMSEQLESIPWEGTVVLASPGKIIVNRGSRDGVSKGMHFVAGETETVVDPDTGEVIDSSMTQAGELEVTEVKEKVAYCKALSGGGNISKGMTIFMKK